MLFQIWANKAPVLAFILTKNNFKHSGKVNNWAGFDAGAAWMALALQVRKVGVITHAMAGFDQNKVYDLLNINPEEYKVMAAIAIGYQDYKNKLPDELQEMEKPNLRADLSNFVNKGKML